MVGGNHTANAVGSLFVLQRHIARRPTPGNAKHVGGARRRSLFGGALVCIVCAGRDAVPLSVRPTIACEVRPSPGQIGIYYYYYSTTTTTTTLPTYLHTGYQSYCAALYAIRAGWLAGWPGVVVARIESPALAGTLKLIRQPTTLVR